MSEEMKTEGGGQTTEDGEQPQERGEGTASTFEPREIVTHQCGAGMDEAIKILVLDEPGPGNACHEYVIGIAGKDLEPWAVEQKISFQKGAVAETGPNGISCEALLAVLIDRLEGFQSGPYPCAENAAALDHCWRALRNLQARTVNRAARSAEGHSKA